MTLPRKYRCKFCDKTFTRKSWHERHTCEKKRRFLESNDIFTISGHHLFNHWQRQTGLLRRGKEKTLEEFCRSPYFNAFKELAVFTEQNYVVSKYQYLDWLILKEIPDRRWRYQTTLARYRNSLQKENSDKQVRASVKNILEWCEDKDVKPSTFFASITPGQALNMVRTTQLSPWVLFGYDESVEDLVERIREGEAWSALDDHININHWIEKVRQDEDAIERVNSYCKRKLG